MRVLYLRVVRPGSQTSADWARVLEAPQGEVQMCMLVWNLVGAKRIQTGGYFRDMEALELLRPMYAGHLR